MCGRSQFLPVPEIESCFAPVRVGDVGAPEEEAFPGTRVPAIVVHRGTRVISGFAWGFFDDGTGHNARLETASTRPAWRDAYARARLVLPLAAFVEGRAWFRPADATVLAVAGLYRLTPDGRRTTMLTRPADGTVAPYHDRMPVILPADLVDAWLAGEPVDQERLLGESPLLLVEPLSARPSRPPAAEQLPLGEG